MVTHEHTDHSRGVGALARDLSCHVFGTRGTLEAIAPDLSDVATVEIVAGCPFDVGDLRVETCPTVHDAVDPIAVKARCTSSAETIGIAYDFGISTLALRRFLRGATALVLEANHDQDLLRVGPYPASVRARIAGRRGHLSNDACAQLLNELAHARLDTVVLAHVSQHCNRTDLVKSAVEKHARAGGFRGRLFVADQDEPLAPFDVGVYPGQLALGRGA